MQPGEWGVCFARWLGERGRASRKPEASSAAAAPLIRIHDPGQVLLRCVARCGCGAAAGLLRYAPPARRDCRAGARLAACLRAPAAWKLRRAVHWGKRGCGTPGCAGARGRPVGPGEPCGGQTWGTPGAMRTTRRWSWERPGAAHPTARGMCKLRKGLSWSSGLRCSRRHGVRLIGLCGTQGLWRVLGAEIWTTPPPEIHPPPEFKFQWIRLHWVGPPNP